MSGEVQTRKRKEKKRKKDEEDTVVPPSSPGNINENLTDNLTFAVYKENTTGGHWCVRIVFFVILAILAGLIGIIILEYRGTTDVDTPIESSRWAFIFDGWVDDSISLFDDKEDIDVVDKEQNGESDETQDQIDHEQDETAEEQQDDGDDEQHDVDEEQDETSKEVEDENEYEDDDTAVKSSERETMSEEDDQQTEEEEQNEINEHRESEEETHAENESNEIEDEVSEDKEDNVEWEIESGKLGEDDESDTQNLDDNDILEEIYGISKEKYSDEKDIYEADDQFDELLEIPAKEEVFERFLDIPGINEITDDNIEPLEEVKVMTTTNYGQNNVIQRLFLFILM